MSTDIAVPRFSRHAVRGLHSVAHLFPKSQRCGIYILEFVNGDRYVGQAIDVVRRFGNHRHNLGDIAFVEFSACRRTQLNDLEVKMIHHERGGGHRLRNIVHGTGPVGESDLDPLVSRSEQFTWLNDPDAILNDEGVRIDDPEQRASRRPQYEHLRQQPMFPVVAGVLHWYIPACLPKPAETERTFWAVSALPATNRNAYKQRLCTLSVNKMEVLFLVQTQLDEATWISGVMNVSLSTLTDGTGSLKSLERKYPDLFFDLGTYESGGGDVASIQFFEKDISLLMEMPRLVEAARAMNLMLMRKGPTFQWRGHCYDLADWGFASDSTTTQMWVKAGVTVGS
jgi:hypothetical protein